MTAPNVNLAVYRRRRPSLLRVLHELQVLRGRRKPTRDRPASLYLKFEDRKTAYDACLEYAQKLIAVHREWKRAGLAQLNGGRLQ